MTAQEKFNQRMKKRKRKLRVDIHCPNKTESLTSIYGKNIKVIKSPKPKVGYMMGQV